MVIIGGGPAGLASAVTLASEGLSVVLFEGGRLGGQASASAAIENYPGFPNGVRGDTLTRKMATQARRFGADIVSKHVMGIVAHGNDYLVADVLAKAVVAATGLVYRQLDIPGKGLGNVLTGPRQVDAKLAVDKHVLAIGGGNSAGQLVEYWAKFARSITLCTRQPLAGTMSSYLRHRLPKVANLHLKEGILPIRLEGTDNVERAGLSDGSVIDTDIVLAEIGSRPNPECVVGCVRDKDGFILTGQDGAEANATNVPGIFAVGDIRAGQVKRVVVAAGDGAAIMGQVSRYLAKHGR